MLIAAHEKKQHPEYQEYVENFEATLTGLEAGLRGGGNPGLIVDKCLDIARSFYDCDSAALVETNLELGYGICVSEHCKEGVVSYEGRVINVTADETPYLYEKIMHNDVFDVQEPKDLFFSNENTTNQTYLCASYSRLSQDDGDKEESNSIVNQKALIRDFMSEYPELQLVEEYADDGFSGVNFERPDFKRMMQDVKSQRINCIIVKDLSRFGRNYIETGKYLEQVFPFLGVRFIAINDSIDTSRAQSDAEQFILPFKNLFNDSYCKDISTKVRSQLAIKRKNGDFVGSFASYGYVKDPGNHNQLIIDPEAAEVVRSIFTWKIQGLSAERISDKLNSLGVLCPMEYKRLHGMKVSTNFRTNDKAKWSPVSVLRILKNELYVGVTTQGKTTTPSYKIKRLVEKPESEWDRVEGTHEAIISQDVFDAVQMLLMRDTRISPDEDQVYLFSGFLCCADCKLNMARRTRRYKEKVYSYRIQSFGK